MKNTLKQLITLYIASFMLYAGNGLFITSMGAKLYDMNISTVMIGVVNSSFFIGIALGSIFASVVLQKVGHIRSFCFFAALYTLEVLAHILTDNIYLWMFFRVGLGFCLSGLLMTIESWFNEKSDTSIRGRVLAFYSLTFYFSYLISVALLSFNMSLLNIFIISSIFTLLALIPVSLTKIQQPVITQKTDINFPNIFKIAPLAILGTFLAGILINGFFTMGSVYILKLGFGAKEVSTFLACAIGGGFLIQLPIGKFSDTYGRRKAFILTSSIAFLSSWVLIVFNDNIHIQYVGSFFLGVGIFTFYSLALARANDVVDKSIDIVEINRGLLFAYGTGSLMSPILLGFLLEISIYGFLGLFAVSSLLLALFALTRDGVPLRQRSVYVPVVGDTSSMVSQMDIREENNAQEIEELQNSGEN